MPIIIQPIEISSLATRIKWMQVFSFSHRFCCSKTFQSHNFYGSTSIFAHICNHKMESCHLESCHYFQFAKRVVYRDIFVHIALRYLTERLGIQNHSARSADGCVQSSVKNSCELEGGRSRGQLEIALIKS